MVQDFVTKSHNSRKTGRGDSIVVYLLNAKKVADLCIILIKLLILLCKEASLVNNFEICFHS